MNTRVLLFAGLRERLQKEEVCLELPRGTKAVDVFHILFGNGDEAEKLIRCTLFAVNQTYVRSDAELQDGDELVLIPPVAGG